MLALDHKRIAELRARRDRLSTGAALGATTGHPVDPQAAQDLLSYAGGLRGVRHLAAEGDVPPEVLAVCSSLARVQVAA